MKTIKRLGSTVAGFLFLAAATSASVQAESVLTNGSFETGDYTGWTVVEEGQPIPIPENGTWGIVYNGQTVNYFDYVFDFYDGILVKQTSTGLPRTHFTTDGSYMAIQLQNGNQNYRLFQDIFLPENAVSLRWSMFYQNHAMAFANDQYLAVHVRDLNDNILETLFVTNDGSPLEIPMSNFAFDISSHAGSTVRIDVEMKVHQHFLDAGFDNFRIELADTASPSERPAPSGWSRSKGKKLEWAHPKKGSSPPGFTKGQKKGWE